MAASSSDRKSSNNNSLIELLNAKIRKIEIVQNRLKIEQSISELLGADTQILEKRIAKINKKIKTQLLSKSITSEEYFQKYVLESIDSVKSVKGSAHQMGLNQVNFNQ